MAEELIERDESLNSMIDKLAEELERKPDEWLNNPMGWLQKQSFTKTSADCDAEGVASPTKKTTGNIFSDFKNRVKTSIKSPYQRRWFVLSTEKKSLIYYSAGMVEGGTIEMSQIVDVQKSNFADAPPFAIDVMCKERSYTLAAESEHQMLLWAYAIKVYRTQLAGEVVVEEESLNSMIDKLAEELERKPDEWLNNPMGWLQKQSFTKTSADCDAEGVASPTKKTTGNIFSDFKNRVKTSIITPYQRRWFVLSTEKKSLIYYKDDSTVLVEGGTIEMSQIVDVQKSNFADAPPFAIDVMCKERSYTLAAESEHQMLLWAYAIKVYRTQLAEEVIEGDESLISMVDKLAEELEKKPDKWVNHPMGWLQKQSFTKTSADCDAEGLETPTKKTTANILSDFKNRVKTSIISPYQRRWFVLSTEKKCLIYYKDDSAGIVERGFIDMSQIIDVQKSNFADAPPFAIDLMCRDRSYTVAAESQHQMVLWAYVINACRVKMVEEGIDGDASLNSMVDKLAEELERKPDEWLNEPMGWLQKQSFTKTSADCDAEGLETPTKKTTANILSDFKNRVKTSIISPYQRRWFVLSTEKKCLIYYKDDSAGIVESGTIDLSQVIDVQKSNFADSLPFAIDVISKDRCYTLAAESEYQMLLWAYAINAYRPQTVNDCIEEDLMGSMDRSMITCI